MSATAVLRRRGVARLHSRHPWIYRSDIYALPDEPGLYPVADPGGAVLGWAAVNPKSEIGIRMLSYGDQPVDSAALAARVDAALDYRQTLAIDADAYRLIHGEADGLPGLIVDRYADVLVVKNGSAALEPHLDRLLERLVERLEPGGVLARFDDRHRRLEGLERFVRVLHGQVPDEVRCREAGHRGDVPYLARPYDGQKTGAFLDQRCNRARLGRYARGRALDAFCYHGAFALHMAAGADSLTCLDSSQRALEQARRNLTAAGHSDAAFVCANAFEQLRRYHQDGERFDTISLDPPALAKRRRDLDKAYGAYKELNLRCLKLLTAGGVMATSSCSAHVDDEAFMLMLRDAAADAGRDVRVLGRYGAAPDHPERLGFPESRYLTFVLLQALDEPR